MVQAGSRVTSRDLQWLEWMARWRFVTGPAIVREFVSRGQSAPPTSVDRRLRALTGLGLVEYERVLAEEPRLYWISRAGMQLVGLTGPVVGPKFADIRHDLRVLDVAHWLTTERVPSHTLITEREIRRSETGNQYEDVPAMYSIELPERVKHSRAYPDLVTVNEEGAAWGHEVEFSRKEHRRLVRLMLGYASAEGYRGAIYYPADQVREPVQRAADEANALAQERTGRRPIVLGELPSHGGLRP